MAKLVLTVDQAAKITGKNKDGTSDTFCRIDFMDKVVKTPVIKKTLLPVWNFSHTYSVPITATSQVLTITLHHQKKKHFLGQVEIPLSEIIRQRIMDKWFKLEKKNPSDIVSGSLKLRIKYKDGTTLDTEDLSLERSHSQKSLKLSPRSEEESEKQKDKKIKKKEKKKDKDGKNNAKGNANDDDTKSIESSSTGGGGNVSSTSTTSGAPLANLRQSLFPQSNSAFQRNPRLSENRKSGSSNLSLGTESGQGRRGTLVVHLLDATDVIAKDINGKSDPFAEIYFEGQQKVSKIQYKTLQPVWDETFMFTVQDLNSLLSIELYDWDQNDKPDFLGQVQISISSLTQGEQGMEEMSQKLQKRSKKSHVSGSLNYILEWHAHQSPDEVTCLVSEDKLQTRRKEMRENQDKGGKVELAFSAEKVANKLKPLMWGKQQEKSRNNPGSLFVNAMEAKFENENVSARLRDKPLCCEMVIEGFSLVTEPKPGPKPKWTKGNGVFHLGDKGSMLKIALYEGSEPKKQTLIAKGKVSIAHLSRDTNQKQWCELTEVKTKEACVMVRVHWRFESDDSAHVGPMIGELDMTVISARNIPDSLYSCTVVHEGSEFFTTSHASGPNPNWNEQVKIPIAQLSDEVQVLLRDKDAEVIGMHPIVLSDLQPGDVLQSWFHLQNSSAQIRLKYEFINTSTDQKCTYDPMVVPKGDVIGILSVQIMDAKQLPKGDLACDVAFEGQRKRTSVANNTQNPTWDQTYDFEVKSKKSRILLTIWDARQQTGIGTVLVPLEGFAVSKKGQIEKDFNIESPAAKKLNPTLHLRCIWKEKVQQSEIPLPAMSDLFSLESVIDETASAKHDISYRVIIIGDSGVGKTNLLGRWVRNEFSMSSVATINVEWSSKTFRVKGKNVQVTFCDTAGQERYKSLTRQYFRGAHGVVLMYDITERNSFNHVENWLEEVKDANTERLPIMLMVGNKNDLADQRDVSTDEAMACAKREDMFFLETSALDGSNCTIAMQLLLQNIHTAQSNIVQVEKPTISLGSNIVMGVGGGNEGDGEPTQEGECSC